MKSASFVGMLFLNLLVWGEAGNEKQNGCCLLQFVQGTGVLPKFVSREDFTGE